MVNGIGTMYLLGLNKESGPRFHVGSEVQYETLTEMLWIYIYIYVCVCVCVCVCV